jgi:predicted  nucleic acid-binding Zn ribbon protein
MIEEREISKGDGCPRCKDGEMMKEELPNGFWVECKNCGHIPCRNG